MRRRRRNTPPQQLAPPPKQQAYAAPPANPAGDTIEVQPGETLYSIARRYGVPVAAIKDANGLAGDSVRPGQRLVLPDDAPDRAAFAARQGRRRRSTAPNIRHAAPASDRAPPVKQAPPPVASPTAVEPPPGWEGRYTMKNGDSLYGIALQHRVTLEELKRANGITDPTKVWTGTVLNVPGGPILRPSAARAAVERAAAGRAGASAHHQRGARAQDAASRE